MVNQKSSSKKVVKKIKERIDRGIINIHATFNNTIISLARVSGAILKQASGGTVGYKGAKKSTPYAAKLAMKEIIKLVGKYQMQEVEVHIKGIGPGRNATLRSLEVADFKISELVDKTPIPHNGCRPPKKPRG